MNVNQFRLALDLLEPTDWVHFERLCSAFLLSEYPDLRTVASASGDGGRDSELFSPAITSKIVFQYSVTTGWKTKIHKTIDQVTKNFENINILIYMSNQLIGALCDTLKNEAIEKGIFLDVRDRNWFIERSEQDQVKESAANELIARIALPYLQGTAVIEKTSSPLTSGEAKAALLYLNLQLQDDITNKGLTKTSFDALVRASLRDSSAEKRMSRMQIHESILKMLPSLNASQVARYIDQALDRISKHYVKHHREMDEFHLSYQEQQRMLERLAELENHNTSFYRTVYLHCEDILVNVDNSEKSDYIDIQQRVCRILERMLLRKGEAFASAIVFNELERISLGDLNDYIFDDIHTFFVKSNITKLYPIVISSVIKSLLKQSDNSTQLYLRRLANSYTLFAFLKQTPDVQSATKKLFSHGTIWLDATAVLPLLAEQLRNDSSLRKIERTLKSCVGAGIKLRITTGIIEEIVSHLNRSFACSKVGPLSWQGKIPYLYQSYIRTGKPPKEFGDWLSLFIGRERQHDDLEQYLEQEYEILREDFTITREKIEPDLRAAIERIWLEAHRSRRGEAHIENTIASALVQHDVETYLGIVALRMDEKVSELGYKHWLLSLDSIAWRIRNDLKEEGFKHVPASPLMSISFLVDNITFGPMRASTGIADETRLPLILDLEITESMPNEINILADKTRRDNEGFPQHVIQRKVRDAIDHARTQFEKIGYEEIVLE